MPAKTKPKVKEDIITTKAPVVLAVKTKAPQPKNTKAKVPINSAIYFFVFSHSHLSYYNYFKLQHNNLVY